MAFYKEHGLPSPPAILLYWVLMVLVTSLRGVLRQIMFDRTGLVGGTRDGEHSQHTSPLLTYRHTNTLAP